MKLIPSAKGSKESINSNSASPPYVKFYTKLINIYIIIFSIEGGGGVYYILYVPDKFLLIFEIWC